MNNVRDEWFKIFSILSGSSTAICILSLTSAEHHTFDVVAGAICGASAVVSGLAALRATAFEIVERLEHASAQRATTMAPIRATDPSPQG